MQHYTSALMLLRLRLSKPEKEHERGHTAPCLRNKAWPRGDVRSHNRALPLAQLPGNGRGTSGSRAQVVAVVVAIPLQRRAVRTGAGVICETR